MRKLVHLTALLACLATPSWASQLVAGEPLTTEQFSCLKTMTYKAAGMDAGYETLLPQQRQSMRRSMLQNLERHYPSLTTTTPNFNSYELCALFFPYTVLVAQNANDFTELVKLTILEQINLWQNRIQRLETFALALNGPARNFYTLVDESAPGALKNFEHALLIFNQSRMVCSTYFFQSCYGAYMLKDALPPESAMNKNLQTILTLEDYFCSKTKQERVYPPIENILKPQWRNDLRAGLANIFQRNLPQSLEEALVMHQPFGAEDLLGLPLNDYIVKNILRISQAYPLIQLWQSETTHNMDKLYQELNAFTACTDQKLKVLPSNKSLPDYFFDELYEQYELEISFMNGVIFAELMQGNVLKALDWCVAATHYHVRKRIPLPPALLALTPSLRACLGDFSGLETEPTPQIVPQKKKPVSKEKAKKTMAAAARASQALALEKQKQQASAPKSSPPKVARPPVYTPVHWTNNDDDDDDVPPHPKEKVKTRGVATHSDSLEPEPASATPLPSVASSTSKPFSTLPISSGARKTLRAINQGNWAWNRMQITCLFENLKCTVKPREGKGSHTKITINGSLLTILPEFPNGEGSMISVPDWDSKQWGGYVPDYLRRNITAALQVLVPEFKELSTSPTK